MKMSKARPYYGLFYAYFSKDNYSLLTFFCNPPIRRVLALGRAPEI
jgi:hypothetical protein